MEAADFRSIAEQECWERSCAGKDPYPSLEAALAHARLLYRGRLRSKRDPVPRQEWAKMAPYKCLFCEPGKAPHWHLGHPV